jgi:protoporphyrinogen oxidase
MKSNTGIAIVGGGMAGLLCGTALKEMGFEDFLILEASDAPGGLCRSTSSRGFSFDLGIHGLYSKTPELADRLGRVVEHSKINVSIADIWRSRYRRHPIYWNMYGLPITKRCLEEFDRADGPADPTGLNFEEWCRLSFGDCIFEEFLAPYYRKFWALEPSELTASWMGPRVPVPTHEQIRDGASRLTTANEHYVQSVWYPNRGGFGAYAAALAYDLPIAFNAPVVGLDPAARLLHVRNQDDVKFQVAILCIPLPIIGEILIGQPSDVAAAARKLRCTSLNLVNIALDCEQALTAHWIYSLDSDISFARLSAPDMWSQENAPLGCSSLQAEIYSPMGIDLTGSVVDRVIGDLQQLKIIRSAADILFINTRYEKYGNVIYDLDRDASVERIQEHLAPRGLLTCGRYARWTYALIDEVAKDAITSCRQALAVLG